MSDEVRSSIFLNSFSEVTPVRFSALLNFFATATAAEKAGLEAWKEVPHFESDVVEKIRRKWEETQRQTDLDIQWVQKRGVHVFLIQQGPYPELLRHIFNAPPIIYALGQSLVPAAPTVALVGSRRCSFYGEKMARQLSQDLAMWGVTTVSGLARGIDTHVHAASIRAKGKTWAVMGSGLSVIYPPENKILAARIEQSGAVISEFPITTKPHPANFPRRNRVIAGLALGTVLVEGTEKSGSLITARLAAEEGRDVMAVPGPATSSLSVAPHRLLRLGAKMVESATDIIEEFTESERSKLVCSGFSYEKSEQTDQKVKNFLSMLGEDPISKEALAEIWKMAGAEFAALLLDLEIKGLVRSVPGGAIVKN